MYELLIRFNSGAVVGAHGRYHGTTTINGETVTTEGPAVPLPLDGEEFRAFLVAALDGCGETQLEAVAALATTKKAAKAAEKAASKTEARCAPSATPSPSPAPR
jgi:hypothetical protein